MHLIILFILALGLNTHAYEVDNFSQRYSTLEDSRKILNEVTNKKFSEALEQANKSKTCDEVKLRKVIEQACGNGVVGTIESFAEESPLVPKNKPQKNDIYSRRNIVTRIKGFVMTAAGRESSINLNGHYIGVDKLGHFFDGEMYWRKQQDALEKGKTYEQSVVAALEHGMKLEEGFYGKGMTGIYSNADQAANYSGFLFFTQMTGGANPYFRCTEGQWKQMRDFDWADWVKPSWDEAINCSMYESDNFQEAVEKQAQALEKEARANRKKVLKYTCPVSKNECVNLQKEYGLRAKYILGKECLEAKSDSTESNVFSAQKPSGISGLQSERKQYIQQERGTR